MNTAPKSLDQILARNVRLALGPYNDDDRPITELIVQLRNKLTALAPPSGEGDDDKRELEELARSGYQMDERGRIHRITTPQSAPVDGELSRIGELIRTQDNRITDQPIFIVQQKRVHVADQDYDHDGIVWVNDDNQEADEAEHARLEAAFPGEGEPELAVSYEWEFVTACFTEQGCKDFIARDGHNLKEPRIYAAGSYRNAEWRTVRNYLAGLTTPPPASQERGVFPVSWLTPRELEARGPAIRAAMGGEAVATVAIDGKPGFRCVVDQAPNVALPVGMKLYASPPATVGVGALRELVRKWHGITTNTDIEYGSRVFIEGYDKALNYCADELAALIGEKA